jgi:hypothetical protein
MSGVFTTEQTLPKVWPRAIWKSSGADVGYKENGTMAALHHKQKAFAIGPEEQRELVKQSLS